MEQERTGKTIAVPQRDLAIVVEQPVTGGFVTDIAVLGEMLGVRQHEIIAQQRRRVRQHFGHARQIAGMKQIRRIR